MHERRLDVGVERRFAGVRWAALEARTAAHAVLVGVRHDRLELGTERPETWHHGRSRTAASRGARGRRGGARRARCRPAGPRSPNGSPSSPSRPAGRVPLLVVLGRRAQRDLGVDRGGAADAVAAEHDQRRLLGHGRLGERGRPPKLMVRARLPAHEVGGRLVRPGFEQQHIGARVRQLAGDDPAARRRSRRRPRRSARLIPSPRDTTSPCRAARRAAARSRSRSQAPGPGAPGRDEVAVERLAGERPDELELGREGCARPAPACLLRPGARAPRTLPSGGRAVRQASARAGHRCTPQHRRARNRARSAHTQAEPGRRHVDRGRASLSPNAP